MAVARLAPALELGQLVQEAVVLDVLQKGDHVGVRADGVGDVQERQPHLGRDVVGDGLRERVGRVLLAQPRLQLLVEPPGGLHPRHDHLMAARIEQDPLQLLDVRGMKSSSAEPDFVRMSRFRAATESWLRAISSVTMAGSVSIGAGASPAGAWPGASSGSDGMKSPRSRIVSQRVPGQRIGPPQDLEEAGAAGRGRQALATSTNSRPPASCIGRGVVSCHTESPRGFMASVIICWWPTER